MKKLISLFLSLSMLSALTLMASAVADIPSVQIESFNEYDYIEMLQESSPRELMELGLSDQEAAETIAAFESALFERALLPDAELRAYGYDDSEIALLRAYANGQVLSSEELQSLGSTCTGKLRRLSCSTTTASFSYTWTWDRCPIVTLSDSAALRWIAYDADGGEIGVEQSSSSMNVDYYYMDKTTSDSSTTVVFSFPGTNEPNLDFNTLNMQFPVYRTYTSSGTGIIFDCYAKSGTVQVKIKVPAGVNQTIHHIFVAGLYGHTLVGVGSPSVSVSKGSVNIGFTGNTSIDSIGFARGTISRTSTIIDEW